MQPELALHPLRLRARDLEKVVAADAVRLGLGGREAGVEAEFVEGAGVARGAEAAVVVAEDDEGAQTAAAGAGRSSEGIAAHAVGAAVHEAGAVAFGEGGGVGVEVIVHEFEWGSRIRVGYVDIERWHVG